MLPDYIYYLMAVKSFFIHLFIMNLITSACVKNLVTSERFTSILMSIENLQNGGLY